MKRNLDLVRLILLKLEGMHNIRNPEQLQINSDEYDSNEVWHNFYILLDIGYLTEYNIRMNKDFQEKTIGYRLTWEGHEFIDTIRDDKMWKKFKDEIKEVRGFSVELLRDLIKGLLRKQIEEYTGVKL